LKDKQNRESEPQGRWNEIVKRWGPVLAMMIVIFVASSIPGQDFPQYNGIWDFIIKKSGHLTVYALLTLSILRGLMNGLSGDEFPPLSQVLAALALAVLYAATDEFHQRFTPGRRPQVLDVGIDLLGSSLALVLYRAWHAIRRIRSQTPHSPSTRPHA
jgi:VanZ family protein